MASRSCTSNLKHPRARPGPDPRAKATRTREGAPSRCNHWPTFLRCVRALGPLPQHYLLLTLTSYHHDLVSSFPCCRGCQRVRHTPRNVPHTHDRPKCTAARPNRRAAGGPPWVAGGSRRCAERGADRAGEEVETAWEQGRSRGGAPECGRPRPVVVMMQGRVRKPAARRRVVGENGATGTASSSIRSGGGRDRRRRPGSSSIPSGIKFDPFGQRDRAQSGVAAADIDDS
jgi:hypothetical protein